jgi:glycerophosphoryl diester phosphodiesterase
MIKSKKIKLVGARPILVAHRGYSGRYPENTLLAYKAAREQGALYMELDLQMTSDRVPVLHHDQSLLRMAGVDIDVRDVRAKYFKALKASYKTRFKDQFADNSFTTFKKFCKWLKNNPELTIFVEIKQESIDRFGIPQFIDAIYRRILQSNVESQCVIISFNHESLEYTRRVTPMRIGWVLPEWSEHNRQLAVESRPDFLFCDKDYLPSSDEEIWRGSWQWAVYNLDDVDSAIEMANRGIGFLETNQIGTLMSDRVLVDTE